MRSISFWRSVDGRFNKITIKIVSFLIGFNNIAGTFECVYVCIPSGPACIVCVGRIARLAISMRRPIDETFRFGARAAVKILATNEPATGENQMIYRKTN